jgi:ATP-binding cassette subfamily B protein
MNTVKKTSIYYWRHLRRYPRLFIPVALILPINTLVNNYLPPLVLASVLNRLSGHDFVPHQVWSSFGGSLLLYLGLSLVGGTLLWRLFDVFYWRLEGNMERSMAREVFNHLMYQSADFHANQFGGSLVSATNKLMHAYVRIADTTLFQVIPLVVGLAFVSVVMISRSPLYTFLLLGFAIFYIVISFFVTGKVRQLGAEQAKAETRQTGVLADAVTNVIAIKSFAREKHENQRFADATNNTYGKLMDMMRAFQRQQVYLSSVTGLLSALSLAAAVVSVVSFNANIATAFLIFNYTSSIVGQLFTFSNNALRNYNRAFGDASEMIDLLSITPEVQDSANPEKKCIKDAAIDFQNVTFTHAGAGESIFEDFNLHIKAGEKIGLVGHSGSGKTTFTRLLLRFSDVDSGEIMIDSQNIANITQKDLRSSITYVPQEPLLFHRSLAENISYGKAKTSQDEIVKFAKLAHAHEFIKDLPKGYETLVGERGIKLSGGQRQRVAIARAMLKEAPILLLDEATSSLDSESEVLIQDALWKLMENKTAIVIAHRLSTIQKMDRIIVLDSGKIVEEGSHRQLLRKNGTYAKLWAHQSGGFIEDQDLTEN